MNGNYLNSRKKGKQSKPRKREVMKKTHKIVRTSGANAPGGVDHGLSVENTML
jgi:hypothetical protein